MVPPHDSQPPWKVATGQQIGPYVVLDRLGQGGMGQVFLATDPRLRRKVALKYLYASLKPEDTVRTSVLREAEAVARITHPNVAIVYDVVEHDERTFIVMEYVEGETLTSRLARERLPEATVIRFGRQLSSALAAAHSKGIIHRDLKPSNIQVTPDNTVKILDFGVAQVCELLSAVAATATVSEGRDVTRTTPIGTLGYMSPEQMRGQSVDTLSDLFSLGAVLFEMTTGRRLFMGYDAAEIAADMSKPAPRADEIDASVSAKLSDLIAELIQIDPRRRVQAAIDVESKLAALDPLARDSAASDERNRAAESSIREMRQRLILAKAPPEVVRVKYEVEQFLAGRPHDVDARLLKDDVDRALSMRLGAAVVRSSMTPPQASRTSHAWYKAGVFIAVAFAGGLLVFGGRATAPTVVEGPIPSATLTTSTIPATAALPASPIPATPPSDGFVRHFNRAETLIAKGDKTGARAENAEALALLPGDSRALSQLQQIAAMPEGVRAGAPATQARQPVPGMPAPKPAGPPSRQPESRLRGGTGPGIAAAPSGGGRAAKPPTETAPAPPPATEPTAPAQPVSDEASIRATLREYAAAQESLSAEAVLRVQPGLDAAALARSFRQLRSQKVEISEVEVISSDGATAVVRCQVRHEFTPKVGQGRLQVGNAVFRLQKIDGRWVIVERR